MQITKRFWIIVSTLCVLVFVFVPIWWNTTGAERRYIPHNEIEQLASKLVTQNDTTVCACVCGG